MSFAGAHCSLIVEVRYQALLDDSLCAVFCAHFAQRHRAGNVHDFALYSLLLAANSLQQHVLVSTSG
eukprot:4042195-Amphidinium_carterae.1